MSRRFVQELNQPAAQAPDWDAFEWRAAMAVASMHGIAALLAERLSWQGAEPWQQFLAEQQAQGLLRDSGRVLLDAEMDAPVVREVREVIEHGKVPARITDLHVWRVGRAQYACVLSLTTPSSMDGDYFRRELAVHEELIHVTVEVDHVEAVRLAGHPLEQPDLVRQ